MDGGNKAVIRFELRMVALLKSFGSCACNRFINGMGV
jgi:hypothetical protein